MTCYIAPKGSVSGSNNGGAGNDAYNGIKAAQTALAAGTAPSGNIVFLNSSTYGAFGAADKADYPCTIADDTGISSSATSSGGMPTLGTNQLSSSSISGRTITFLDGSGRAKFDMSGNSGGSARMHCALFLQGEDITVESPDITAGTFDWRALNAAATTYLDQASFENMCLRIDGAGNTVQNGDFDGASGWSSVALFINVPRPGSGASTYKLTTVDTCTFTGTGWGIRVRPGGSGSGAYDLVAGSRLLITGCTFADPCFGRRIGTDATGVGYNASTHCNAIGVDGSWLGRAVITLNDISGPWQDAIECAVGNVIDDNNIHDISSSNPTAWVKSGSSWVRTALTQTEGNGLKLGLNGYDGKSSPAAWLGADGTAGGSVPIAESNNIAVRNRIKNISGIGITNNDAYGCAIHANEIENANICLNLQNPDTSRTMNHWVSHNYLKINPSASSGNAAMYAYGKAKLWLFNNIIWGATGHPDIYWASTATIAAQGGNLFVTNSIGTMPNSGNRTSATPSTYVFGSGFPALDPYLSGGNASGYALAKFYRATVGRNGSKFDGTSPALGPFA